MSFSDRGVLLDSRAHGETHAVAYVFTENHGRRAGLVYGGQGKIKRALLQPGNEVSLEWKGRGEDSLGHFSLEMLRARAGEAMQDRLSLAALGAACALAQACLPEREAHAPAYRAMAVLLDNLDAVDLWPALMARWELGLLSELGFGLTLDRCAATGSREDLLYVSPRSACAVSADAGAPYRDKLLALPAFIRDGGADADLSDAIDGLALTGYFIETRILHLADKTLPDARRNLIALLSAQADAPSE